MLFSEKTLAKHLRVRDFHTHNHLHIFSWFSSTPTSPSIHPWEVLSLNTYLTHSECWEKFWCLWKVLEEAIEWRMQLGWIMGSRKLVKIRLRKVRGSRSLEGSSTLGKLGVFSPSFSVSFSIIRLCIILCLYLSFLLFKLYFYCSMWLHMA